MAKIEILVGTTLGSAEYVADEISAQLSDLGHDVQLQTAAKLADTDKNALWLLVSSTHGAGDLPDNIQPFYKELMLQSPDLSHVKFALCAIGDSSYDTFCQGPEALISLLESLGATAFVDKIQIDVQADPVPEEPAIAWLTSWQSLI